MLRYVLRRLAYGVIVLWGAFTGAFFLLYILPGDAAGAMSFGEADGAGALEQIEENRRLLGLDRPVIVQYGDALVRAVQGDFGTSLITKRPADEMYFEALGETLKLAFTGFALAVVLGVALAVVVELTRWRWLRELLVSLPAVVVSLPSFWLGLMLLQLFSFQLRWIPATGNEGLPSLLFAASALAIGGAGSIAQLLTANLRGALSSPYVETVRNWGLSQRGVVLRHALKNASLPVITSLGTTIGAMVGGTVLIETVFSRVGVGRIVVNAVDARDTPVVLVAVTISAVIFVVVNLIVDLIYPFIDKRIRLEVAP